MRRIYLAASWSVRGQMLVRQRELRQMGHYVTSTWLDDDTAAVEPGPDPNCDDPERAAGCARADAADLMLADLVIMSTDVPSTTGGFHVELGLALAAEKEIILVGPRLNIFHYLPTIQHYDSWTEVLTYLGSINATSGS
jgi:hypothetical protein